MGCSVCQPSNNRRGGGTRVFIQKSRVVRSLHKRIGPFVYRVALHKPQTNRNRITSNLHQRLPYRLTSSGPPTPLSLRGYHSQLHLSDLFTVRPKFIPIPRCRSIRPFLRGLSAEGEKRGTGGIIGSDLPGLFKGGSGQLTQNAQGPPSPRQLRVDLVDSSTSPAPQPTKFH